MHAMAAAKKRWKVFDPHSKLACRNTWRIIAGIVQDAEDSIGKKFSDRSCHAREAQHEEINRVTTVQFE
jgi:hypothetical protein